MTFSFVARRSTGLVAGKGRVNERKGDALSLFDSPLICVPRHAQHFVIILALALLQQPLRFEQALFDLEAEGGGGVCYMLLKRREEKRGRFVRCTNGQTDRHGYVYFFWILSVWMSQAQSLPACAFLIYISSSPRIPSPTRG